MMKFISFLGKAVIMFFVGFGLVAMLVDLLQLSCAKDSTDPVDGRSGLRLFKDAATGCNYLERSGNLAPRYKPDGTIWCDPPAQGNK